MVTPKRSANKTVRVTFELPGDIVAEKVAVCGDFNDWSTVDLLMRKTNEGTWRAITSLPAGRRYRYRYLIDDERWENDWQADEYEPNPYGSDDSIVFVP